MKTLKVNQAQTIIQLYEQLKDEGYSLEDFCFIKNCYEEMLQFISCKFRASGKTLLSHFIGAASVLCSLNKNIEIITSALAHSIYIHGDFGNQKNNIDTVNRKTIEKIFGRKVENYLFEYQKLRWDKENILYLSKNFDDLDQIKKDVILLRLADFIDEYSENELKYTPGAKWRSTFAKEVTPNLIVLAEKLGYPELKDHFDKIIHNLENVDVPDFLRNHPKNVGVYNVNPKSFTKKNSIKIYEMLNKVSRIVKT